jgi:hypothetical protein
MHNKWTHLGHFTPDSSLCRNLRLPPFAAQPDCEKTHEVLRWSIAQIGIIKKFPPGFPDKSAKSVAHSFSPRANSRSAQAI